MTGTSLPPEAFAAALAGLPAMTPRRLARLLRRLSPPDAWAAVTRGGSADPLVAALLDPKHLNAWATSGRTRPPERVWARCQSAGVVVHLLGSPTYPEELAADHQAPAVLFSRGSMAAVDGARAAVIGTRNATSGGRELAAELGAGLAAAGVRVVSGLARGIDGWAHRGALRADGAPPIGVVACGLDVPYPSEHRALWDAVAERGVLLSEVPPGTAPQAHRFPLRNRILAALADVVVVVESRSRGGSLITATEAERRGVPVLAVPGSPRSVAAAGTNRLLIDGCSPVVDTTDVLAALGLARPTNTRLPLDHRRAPTAGDQIVLDLFADEPLTLEHVAARSDLSPVDAALALGRLEAGGWLLRTAGWFEHLGPLRVSR